MVFHFLGKDFTIETVIACIFIIAAFVYFFFRQLIKINKISEDLVALDDSQDILSQLKKSELEKIGKEYEKTINIKTNEGIKSNYPAYEFFNDYEVCKAKNLNLKQMDAASGTLVGLGLLGTFVGLTFGIWNFDSSSTDSIKGSIQGLLNGMGTAFFTSLFGMGFSLIFTFFDKRWRNKFSKALKKLTDDLDNKYYIDDAKLASMNQAIMLNELKAALISEFNGKLTYKTNDDRVVPLGAAVREILTENQQQSKALKSFSTDLAIELNNGFDEVLSRQMQEKILPLMESVDATTKAVIEHIDTMAEKVTSPASDMMDSVVEELKQSMTGIMNEFSKGLSGNATKQLEDLAVQLGSAAKSMADFPTNMENISSTLQVTIEEVKTAISEISNTSATANSAAMQQMQEQVTFATGAISNAIGEIKEVMHGITTTSQEQTNQMVAKLAEAAQNMGAFMNKTVTGLAEDMASKQGDLIALQDDTTNNTKRLLETFNTSISHLGETNEKIVGTMDMFQNAQGQITGTTAHLQTIAGDMKLATQLFNKSITDHTAKLESLQLQSQRGIDEVTKLINESSTASDDYIQKFELIKNGLNSIFTQLQSGLSEYSKTVKATTQSYLDQYSTVFKESAGTLAGANRELAEAVEMLEDSLSKNRK